MGLFDFTEELVQTVKDWDGTIGAPSPMSRKKPSIAVYENYYVETYLASSHPITPGFIYVPIILYTTYFTIFSNTHTLAVGAALWMLGLLIWTFAEYAVHRWLFHWDPGEDHQAKLTLFLIHGYHHEFPNDTRRLVAPPLASAPVAAVVAVAYYFILGPDLWLTMFGGTIFGYLSYDWIHYATHHFSMNFPIGKMVRRAHMVHHFKLFNLNMGISSPFWDFILGSWAWSDEQIKDAMKQERTLQR